MKGSILNILCLIVSFISLTKGQSGKLLKHRNSSRNILNSTILLVDLLFDIDFESRITVHNESTKVNRNTILEKSKNYAVDQCYAAINSYTKYMRQDPYKKMQLYSFSDIADVGDYSGCQELTSHAEWNYINVNLTKLPVDVRFGLCFPKECTQVMMNQAADSLSAITFKLVQTIGWITDIEFIRKQRLGAEVSFIQPKAWRETQIKNKSIGAIAVLALMSLYAGLVISLSLLLHWQRPSKNSWENKKYVPNEKESFLSGDGYYTGNTTPSDYYDSIRDPINFPNDSREVSQTDPFILGFSPRKQSTPMHQIPTKYVSITPRSDNMTTEESTDISAQKDHKKSQIIVRNKFKGSFWENIINCFSIQRNITSLHMPINKFKEDEDLAFIDGMRVLTMLWVILSLTAVYTLISNLSDPIMIFVYFQGYPFAFLAGCFITPELFVFYIFFLGFIYMARFYDLNGGIGFTDYIRFYIHRFLKLAPMYYLVFFFSWFLYPLIFTNPGWFVSERFSKNCEEEWPFVLTFLNNFIPFFTQALNGCYYWPYVIPNDMILHLFFPFLVILYKKRRTLFYITNIALLVGGCLLDFYITIKNRLRVGILTFEDYYLYSCFYNKPYTKLPILACGMGMGAFYLRLIKYKQASDEDQKKKFPLIHFMNNSLLFAILLYAYAFCVINFINIIQVSSNRNGYSWGMNQNGIFFALSRFGYISGIMAVILNILTGKGRYIKVLLSYYLWRPLARLNFTAYLIFPLVIGAAIFNTKTSLYVTYISIIPSMFSCIILTYTFALFAFLLFEKPMENLKNYIKFLIFGDESLLFDPNKNKLETLSQSVTVEDLAKKKM
ncbi:unnamed protein product [Moneuplotes crassus]|uniref:Acyltransferase 3 domain-containing protein n=1 Tax=Euplotes crassus TaxID=5936 RepID=A0AAD2D7S4_EUPCR|nr:unnamed protein product [Moneuplotes crassus]